jgi:hypothetical protein
VTACAPSGRSRTASEWPSLIGSCRIIWKGRCG